MMAEAESGDRRLLPNAVLAAVAIVWGGSFVIVKDVLRTSPPLAFLAVRFLLAAVLMLPFLLRRGGRRRAGFWRDTLVLGGLLFVGMATQVVGQVETSASKAAFITGLSTPLTPLAGYLRTRRAPSLENVIGVVLASAGFLLLTWPSGGTFNRGDIMVSLCAAAFAAYLVELSLRGGRQEPMALVAGQLWVVALSAGALSLLFRRMPAAEVGIAFAEARPLETSGMFLFGVLFLGTVGTVGTFSGQTWAQRHMSATHAAILFTFEPVAAALLAAWLLGERLGARATAGAVLVLAGVVASELRMRSYGHAPEVRQRGNGSTDNQ
jgi:drug/metabolite transporter (DMT)-like permease